MNTMNKIYVFKNKYNKAKDQWYRLYAYTATFIQWGIDSESDNNGILNFTVAIVECTDGEIRMIYPTFIKFAGTVKEFAKENS